MRPRGGGGARSQATVRWRYKVDGDESLTFTLIGDIVTEVYD